MFEFNPDLVVGDDQEASTEALTSREARTRGERNENEEEEEEEEEKREEEGIDITDIAGYTDEPVPSLPREERCQRIEGDVAGTYVFLELIQQEESEFVCLCNMIFFNL